MIEVRDINPTQLAGLFAFGAAAAACAVAAIMRREWLWAWMAAISAGLALEAVLGVRHRLRAVVDGLLQAQGWYAGRAPVQIGLLWLCGVLLAAALWWLAGLRRVGRHARVAAGACTAALCLFFMEAISLHGVDSLMYASLGPVRWVGWVWLVLGVAVAGSALSACTAGGEGL